MFCNTSKLLGQGGFAKVFYGTLNDRPVAIKRLENIDVDVDGEREKDALIKLNHPNIIRLLHYEEDNNFKYYYYSFKVNNENNQ